MTTLLLIGANGQIGWELARTLMPMGTVVIPERRECDLTRPETIGQIVDAVRPQVIVNAAAYTAVDNAEREQEQAFAVNAVSVGALATAARRYGALVVHYSTDYVFDGSKAEAYTEDDAPRPVSAYGRSKLAGEEAIRVSGADHLIFRTSWIFAARGKNFLKTILRLAGEREELRIVGDQTGAPTWARLVAQVTAMTLAQDIKRRADREFHSGTFHLTAAGATTWHGFAEAIVKEARARGASLACQRIEPITTAEYPLPAPRPVNSRLAGAKLSQRYALQLPDWEHGMRLCLAELFP